MTNDNFEMQCKLIVTDYANRHVGKVCSRIVVPNNVFVIAMCKSLQNNKAFLGTTYADGMLYEINYNGDKEEFYLDVYSKVENICIDSRTLSIKSKHDGTFDTKEK